MKKKYTVPSCRFKEEEILCLLTTSNVMGAEGSPVNDFYYGGVDVDGEKDPDARMGLVTPHSVWDE